MPLSVFDSHGGVKGVGVADGAGRVAVTGTATPVAPTGEQIHCCCAILVALMLGTYPDEQLFAPTSPTSPFFQEQVPGSAYACDEKIKNKRDATKKENIFLTFLS